MRSLEQALNDHELVVLRVIGEWWELDLTGSDKVACVKALAEKLAQLDIAQEMIYLPPEEAAALNDLFKAGGRIPVATFSREHGAVRLMGPGRLEREEPWLEPVGVAEALWYRGFLYRGFDETAGGLIEFYYLPQELQAQFPAAALAETVAETAVSPLAPVPAPDEAAAAVTDAVDDLTTILALAQRASLRPGGVNWPRLLLNPEPDRRSLLMTLAQEMGFLRATDEGLRPTRAAVAWLKQSREAQLRALADAWSRSNWNDLCHTPGLRCEGDNWRNDPILARTALLDALPRAAGWFRLADLVTYIKETNPDFQRPDGNYDTWYIRDVADDVYLTGFANWDLIESRLIRFLVQGALCWLGLAETGGDPEETLYRLTPRARQWLANKPPERDEVVAPLVVRADASLLAPRDAGRYQRFQAARISEVEPVEPGQPFRYRLTPRSLAQAREQGITPGRILRFLEEASGRPLPGSVKRAVNRWGERGIEARLETAVILRVRDAAILDTLRANPKTRPFIAESLGELAAVVRRKDWPKLRAAAAQLGLLLASAVEDEGRG